MTPEPEIDGDVDALMLRVRSDARRIRLQPAFIVARLQTLLRAVRRRLSHARS